MKTEIIDLVKNIELLINILIMIGLIYLDYLLQAREYLEDDKVKSLKYLENM